MPSKGLDKGLGAALLILGLFLGIDPLTLVIAVPMLLGGFYFLYRGMRRRR